MKFTLKWLKEYLNTNASLCEICDKLNQIGLEVEELVDAGEILKDFTCVLVESVENHPNSDHLHICKVRKKDGELLQIVCGAPNVKNGMKAVLAPVNSVIPNGEIKITKSKIRNIESCGMLCSEKELKLGEDASGIMELDENIELGTSIAKIKNLDDVVIDINLTPNKGDCLGIYGIARDLSATGIGKLEEFKNYEIKASVPTTKKIEIQNDNCAEFAFRYIKNLKNCESPTWIQEKLKAVGINPKSALVDITNYVMLVLNRPLHCYDASKIIGNIVITTSKGGEKFLALNNEEYILDKDVVLINDSAKNILCLGGIIGGIGSASSINTTEVIVECANFDPITTAKSARSLNINTDAKFRFERGIDFNTTDIVLNYTTYLINTICGGENSEIIKTTSKSFNKNIRILNFHISSVELILGLKIERSEVIQILKNLGYGIREDLKNLDILVLTIPTWRNDIILKENVVEDIIRIYGYNNLKEIKINEKRIGDNPFYIANQNLENKFYEIARYLASKNMIEIVSWSFMDEKIAKEFFPINEQLKVVNPINNILTYMRPTIIPNLMTIAKYNQDNFIENISIFEKGKVFIDFNPEGQKENISGIRMGSTCEKNVFKSNRPFDIFDVKNDALDILKLFEISVDSLSFTNDFPDYYHPFRSSAIKLGNKIVGVFGEIHPLKVKQFDIKNKVNAFEIFTNNLPLLKQSNKTQKKQFILNDLQPIMRDFSFIINKDLEVGNLITAIKNTNKELIKEVYIFDIYQGKNISEEQKSIAFSIKIQPKNKLLNGEEIDLISNKIVNCITTEFKGILRDS